MRRSDFDKTRVVIARCLVYTGEYVQSSPAIVTQSTVTIRLF